MATTVGVALIVAATRQAPADVVDPRIKSLNYLNRLLARLEAIRAGADEAIMLNHRGHIAEGTTDNVFLVRNGALLTPLASDGALEGITRGVVLALAAELGIAARQEPVGVYDLRTSDEAFLVGTGVGLLAIRSVDGHALPHCPGPVYRQIEAAFDALVRSETAGLAC
jgi:branched-chain amino acid aminotransferase